MKKSTLYEVSNTRTMKKATFLFMFLAIAIASIQAQDVHFSQFFEAPLLRNPSLAGIFDGDIRVQGVYRNQWGSVTVPYKTGSFNFEYKQPIGRGDDFLTTGLQVVYDKAGTTNFTTSSLLPAINYHKSLSADKVKFLSLGFMGGFVQRRIDRSKMTTNNHFDGNGYNPALADGETFVNANYSYLDGSVGMSFNSGMGDRPDNHYFVGVAYHHFNRPKNSFYTNPSIELNPKVVASAGVRFALNETSYFTLQADHTEQGAYNETIGGALYSYKMGGEDYESPMYTLHFGAFLRWKDALIPVVKLDYHPFSVALSYDVNVSELKTASQSRGGMELSVTYSSFFDRDNSSKNAVICPKF
jgi:type IX secretion system PorP/SprF family membrane protein